MSQVTMTNHAPNPPRSDFAFCIDFKRGEGPASRIFLATYDFINACEKLDRELVSIIDSSIEPVMVLEDVEAGSLKTYFRTKLESVDDQALKDVLDWKKIAGRFLVKCKYLVLERMNEDPREDSILSLRKEIQKLGSETDVRHLPVYAEPKPSALMQGIQDFQSVKDRLSDGDAAYIESQGGIRLDLDLRVRWDITTVQELSTTSRETHRVASMVFSVKKPDYLGDSKWDLRYADRPLSVKIEDLDWLRGFQTRRFDVRPGDALDCTVRIEVSYGLDNEVLTENHY